MKNQVTTIYTRLLIMAICLFSMPMIMSADSYSSLWKKVEDARQKDLPKTEMAELEKIIQKAKGTTDYGQLLKASLQHIAVETQVAPDSITPALERLKAEEEAARKKNPALAAVYQSLLGHIYTKCLRSSDENVAKGKEYYKMSMQNPEKLAAVKASAYEPMAIQGADANIFYNDLLHLLGFEAKDYQTMHDYYQKDNNRSAACLCAFELLQQDRKEDVMLVKKSKYLQTIDSLINVYQDLPVAGELAIERYRFMERAMDTKEKEKIDYINYALNKWGVWPRMNILRNAKNRLTQPSFLAEIGNQVLTPNEKHLLRINTITNIQQLTLTVTRLNLKKWETLNPENKNDMTRIKQLMQLDTQIQETHRYIGLPDYQVSSDTIEIAPLPVGVYLAEITTNNNDVPTERALFYVSNLLVIHEELPGKNIRFIAVDATTGAPVPNAKIKITEENRYGKKGKVETITCGKDGELVYNYPEHRPDFIEVYTEDDHFCPQVRYDGWFSYYDSYNSKHDEVDVYTDRAIYRPGQTVHAAIVFYNRDNENATVVANEGMKIALYNANNEKLSEKSIVTDEFGTASVDFALPTTGLTGRFSLRSNYTNHYIHKSFRVEEYKRPTFEVEFEKVTEKYQSGDTVQVKGTAKTYSGVPVQGAQVAYTVTRRPSLWWYGRGNTETIATDTVKTDSEGKFSIPVYMELPESSNSNEPRAYSYNIEANITNTAGESHPAETSLPLSNRDAFLSSDLPSKVQADSLLNVTFSYKNIAREDIPGTVNFSLKSSSYDKSFTCEANKPFDLKKLGLKSGLYKMEAVCGKDTLKQQMVVFSLKDKTPVIETHDWFFASAKKFPNDGKPVYIQVGSSDEDQYIFYTIVSGNKVLEKNVIRQSNAINTRAFTYKKEWGDGIAINYAWVRGGKLYTHTIQLTRPVPSKKLNMKWTTFRDRLTPGQKETWTLNITDENNKPAKAQLLSVLYDKSLDQIASNSWSWGFTPSIYLPYLNWQATTFHPVSIYGEMPIKWLSEKELEFTHWDEEALDIEDRTIMIRGRGPLRSRNMVLAKAAPMEETAVKADIASFDVKANDDSGEVLKAKEVIAQPMAAEASVESQSDTKNDTKKNTTVQVRENLNETAFFYPALVADGKGNVNIQFTLPESTTTWRFMGLAHDKTMNCGFIDGEAVASKDVMIQPNMPRFVRRGDKPTIAATVSNTSDKNVSGKVRIEYINPETDKVILATSKNITLNAHETKPLTFNIIPKNYPDVVIVRMMVEGKNFSDGEQHYLPVLPDKEIITTTQAFSLQNAGSKTIDLQKFFPTADRQNRLTYEYTARPEWLLIESLPTVSNPSENNAISLAVAYYANTLSKYLLNIDPSIKKFIESDQINKVNDGKSPLANNQELKTMLLDETPWVADAKNETEQRQLLKNFFDENQTTYRLNDSFTKLQKLQNPDGSFSWWKGMEGSRYMTSAVYKTLVRLQKMTGTNTAKEISKITFPAALYLSKELEKEVVEMKKQEKKGAKNVLPSETAIDIIYSLSLAEMNTLKDTKASINYIVEKLAKVPTAFTIYGKANTAVVLALNGKKEKAKEYLKSVNEYTVYKPEMGRYYDSRKAYYSWFDYKIPTQVAVIEAYKLLENNDKQFIADLQQWLLQSKRTQAWDTPLNTVNAVYAFLGGNDGQQLTTNAENDFAIRLNGTKIDTPNNAIGYVKGVETGSYLKNITFEKTTSGTSWGAIYAQSVQTTADVQTAGTNLKVKREVLGENANAKVGDRVRVRLTITADRDYDFVQLQDKRAACLEPVGQLSGYHWGYYIAPKDNSTNYYFDRLPKGETIIETEYYIDRAGEYTSGICTVQCAYAPEYSGRDAAFKLTIK